MSLGKDLTFHSIMKELDDVDKFPLESILPPHCPGGFSVDCVEGLWQVYKDRPHTDSCFIRCIFLEPVSL